MHARGAAAAQGFCATKSGPLEGTAAMGMVDLFAASLLPDEGLIDPGVIRVVQHPVCMLATGEISRRVAPD